jgi:tetratricopeptide (TPR) repeat protein
LARDPSNLLARRDLCGYYLEKRLYGKARACFQLVLSSSPDDFITQFQLGIAERHMERFQEAAEHLETACRIAPEVSQCVLELDAARKQVKY